MKNKVKKSPKYALEFRGFNKLDQKSILIDSINRELPKRVLTRSKIMN